MKKKKTKTREGQNEVQPATNCEVKNEESVGENAMRENLPKAPPSPPTGLGASLACLKWLLQTLGGVSQSEPEDQCRG